MTLKLLLYFSLGLVFVVAQQACRGFQGPSQARLDCLSVCGDSKDACILEAQTVQQIQTCDSQSQNCTWSCPHH